MVYCKKKIALLLVSQVSSIKAVYKVISHLSWAWDITRLERLKTVIKTCGFTILFLVRRTRHVGVITDQSDVYLSPLCVNLLHAVVSSLSVGDTLRRTVVFPAAKSGGFRRYSALAPFSENWWLTPFCRSFATLGKETSCSSTIWSLVGTVCQHFLPDSQMSVIWKGTKVEHLFNHYCIIK